MCVFLFELFVPSPRILLLIPRFCKRGYQAVPFSPCLISTCKHNLRSGVLFVAVGEEKKNFHHGRKKERIVAVVDYVHVI